MTRYFYTDPLAAAWMAKHFGMLFVRADGIPLNFNQWGNGGYWREGFGATDFGPYHIHPDSLPLLKPRDGDVAVYQAVTAMGEEDYGEVYHFRYAKGMDNIIRIIQRDGKPFHWPEVEP